MAPPLEYMMTGTHGHGHGHVNPDPHRFLADPAHYTVFGELDAQYRPVVKPAPHPWVRRGVQLMVAGAIGFVVVLVLLSAFNHSFTWAHPNLGAMVAFVFMMTFLEVSLLGGLMISFTHRTLLARMVWVAIFAAVMVALMVQLVSTCMRWVF